MVNRCFAASVSRQTDLTAPNRAPSHSFFSVSTVLSGRAVPLALKQSKPASRSTKLKFRPSDEGKDSRIFLPAYVKSCELICLRSSCGAATYRNDLTADAVPRNQTF